MVGESGSGKSTLRDGAWAAPTHWHGRFRRHYDVGALARPGCLLPRPAGVQTTPYSSPDPMYSVLVTEEPLRVQGRDRRQRQRAVRSWSDRAALLSSILAAARASGGCQRQCMIARLALERPEVLVCDEAVSALDRVGAGTDPDLLADLQADLFDVFVHQP
ncbi:ATP-binding cassette domain-containing protein [Mycobacterium tuberculosis]